jgi:hypothetical protein
VCIPKTPKPRLYNQKELINKQRRFELHSLEIFPEVFNNVDVLIVASSVGNTLGINPGNVSFMLGLDVLNHF